MNCEPKNKAAVGPDVSTAPGRGDEAANGALGSGLTEDAFLGGQLRLRQPARGHRAGHDAILLAAAVSARPDDRVVEFGCGAGAAGLAVARRVGGVQLTMLEIDPVLADIARTNAALNGLAAEVHVLDVGANASAFEDADCRPASADHVMMNPPFNDGSRHQASPDTQRASAHIAARDTLEIWIDAARRVLKPRGTLTVIWRADGLADVLTALRRGFGGVAVLPVYPRPNAAAIRILVSAIKESRAPMRINRGLVLNSSDGSPAQEADAILKGKGIRFDAPG